MHTVPQVYFKAFTFADSSRRDGEAIMRFDRQEPGRAKPVGLNASEVVKDIYTVFDKDGKPDSGIENILCKYEGDFASALRPIIGWDPKADDIPIDRHQWFLISRFMAAQMLRTPAFFAKMAVTVAASQMTRGRDYPPRVMLFLIQRWALRLTRMRGSIIRPEGGLPLITSDNPVALWNRTDFAMAPGGIDQHHPNLAVSCPLTPTLLYMAEQTPESHAAILTETNQIATKNLFKTNLLFGTMPGSDVKKVNALCVANAHKRVYANYCDQALIRFLDNRFWSEPPTLKQPVNFSL